jgi:hypothetical protein
MQGMEQLKRALYTVVETASNEAIALFEQFQLHMLDMVNEMLSKRGTGENLQLRVDFTTGDLRGMAELVTDGMIATRAKEQGRDGLDLESVQADTKKAIQSFLRVLIQVQFSLVQAGKSVPDDTVSGHVELTQETAKLMRLIHRGILTRVLASDESEFMVDGYESVRQLQFTSPAPSGVN